MEGPGANGSREPAYDLAVVGAGLGGLGLAALCARAGLKVFVCERNHYPGGYACDFGRKGTRFDASLHSIGGCGPGGMTREVLERCGVADDVAVVPLPTFYRAVFPDLDLRIPSDPGAYRELLATHFPAERDGIARIFADWAGILRELTRFDGSRVPNFLRALLFPLLSWRTLRAARSTLGQAFAAARVRDPRLRAVLAQLWVYLGLPPDKLSAIAFAPAWASYHAQGSYHLGATAASLSAALVAAIEKAGGTIRYQAPAEALLLEGRRAAGVRLE
ncbi:MAG: NAD(P)-binding protein, partial [Planctomycetales bacterium]|nr:NAD(P)-binding protein [Planctomycetales bacterium]